MFIHLSIHFPKAGKEELVQDSMMRFRDAVKSEPGMQHVYTLKDVTSNQLVGLSIWDSQEDMMAAIPKIIEATKEDDIEAWEKQTPVSFRLTYP